MQKSNLKVALLILVTEAIGESITTEDNWQPFNELVMRLQAGK